MNDLTHEANGTQARDLPPESGADARPAGGRRRHHLGLGAIAVFKLIKATVLLAAAIGLLRLVNKDIPALVVHWITALRMDPDNHYVNRLLAWLANIDPHRLRAISAGSFLYAGLLSAEGIGLWLERRWAEYLTVVATSCFVPLELYGLVKKPDLNRVLILLLNLIIVAYLVSVLRQSRRHS